VDDATGEQRRQPSQRAVRVLGRCARMLLGRPRFFGCCGGSRGPIRPRELVGVEQHGRSRRNPLSRPGVRRRHPLHFGGTLNNNRQDKAYSYKASTNTWLRLSNSGLTPRSAPFRYLGRFAFRGLGRPRRQTACAATAALCRAPSGTALANFGAPSARMIAFRRFGLGLSSGSRCGGHHGGQVSLNQAGTLTTTGALYNVGTSVWTTIATWPSMEAHEYGMGVWTGEEFVLWGGRDKQRRDQHRRALGTLSGSGVRTACHVSPRKPRAGSARRQRDCNAQEVRSARWQRDF